MSHRILVIEDEEDMQFMLREALGRRGYDVETAGTGDEGLIKLKAASFDLILLDVRLPGQDGVSLIPTIKEIDPMSIIILMTAFGSRRLQSSAYDYFTKPFRMDEMYTVIQRAIEKRQLLKDIHELERRHKNSDHVQPKVEVFSKLSFPDCL